MGETLQMGHVPIHVYLDIPWVPYADMFEQIGFKTTVSDLPELLKRLSGMSVSSLERMEATVRAVTESHFTTDGLLEQISRFLTGGVGRSDLRCQRLPETINS